MPETRLVVLKLESNILSGGGIVNPPSGGGYDDVMRKPNPDDYDLFY